MIKALTIAIRLEAQQPSSLSLPPSPPPPPLLRYAAVRKQFGPSSEIEVPLLEYQLHVKYFMFVYFYSVCVFICMCLCIIEHVN